MSIVTILYSPLALVDTFFKMIGDTRGERGGSLFFKRVEESREEL